MSFYTGLVYYRPCEPPAMTGQDLGQFIAKIYELGVLKEGGFEVMNVRFGDFIDQDEKTQRLWKKSPLICFS